MILTCGNVVLSGLETECSRRRWTGPGAGRFPVEEPTMDERTCSVGGCDTTVRARGWCAPHYERWRRWGDPLGGGPRQVHVPRGLTTADRFWSKVNRTKTCWLWTAATHHGYGRFSVDGVSIMAHRFSVSLREPLIEGMEVDHLCRVRLCVNPAHLEQVTPAVNRQRAADAIELKTHCFRGHPYDEANTIVRKSDGNRMCRECRRLLRIDRKQRRAKDVLP